MHVGHHQRIDARGVGRFGEAVGGGRETVLQHRDGPELLACAQEALVALDAAASPAAAQLGSALIAREEAELMGGDEGALQLHVACLAEEANAARALVLDAAAGVALVAACARAIALLRPQQRVAIEAHIDAEPLGVVTDDRGDHDSGDERGLAGGHLIWRAPGRGGLRRRKDHHHEAARAVAAAIRAPARAAAVDGDRSVPHLERLPRVVRARNDRAFLRSEMERRVVWTRGPGGGGGEGGGIAQGL